MGYTAGSFSAGQQPTTAQWNVLWANDSSFNDGTGIAAGAIITASLADASVTVAKRTGGFFVGSIAAATLGSTGNKSVTGVGFKPKIVRFTVFDTVSAAHTSASSGAMDLNGNQFYVASAGTTTNVAWNGDTTHCFGHLPSTSTTPHLLATYVSMDTDGFTYNVGTSNSSFIVAFECYA